MPHAQDEGLDDMFADLPDRLPLSPSPAESKTSNPEQSSPSSSPASKASPSPSASVPVSPVHSPRSAGKSHSSSPEVSSPASRKRKRSTPSTSTSSSISRSSSPASSVSPTHQSDDANLTKHTAAPHKQPPTRKTTPEVSTSPFATQTASLYLPLPPISQQQPLAGLCAEHLSPLLLSYYPPLRGVILAYHDAYLSNTPPAITNGTHKPPPKRTEPVYATAHAEYAAPYTWLTATFTLFAPTCGSPLIAGRARGQATARAAEMEGYVTLQNESQIGLVCYNQFNATISKDRLPTDWTWSPAGSVRQGGKRYDVHGGESHTGEGAFVDGEGKRVEGLLKFTVVDVEGVGTGGGGRGEGFVSVEGSLLPRGQDGIDDTDGAAATASEKATATNGMRAEAQATGGAREKQAGVVQGRESAKSKIKASSKVTNGFGKHGENY